MVLLSETILNRAYWARRRVVLNFSHRSTRSEKLDSAEIFWVLVKIYELTNSNKAKRYLKNDRNDFILRSYARNHFYHKFFFQCDLQWCEFRNFMKSFGPFLTCSYSHWINDSFSDNPIYGCFESILFKKHSWCRGLWYIISLKFI